MALHCRSHCHRHVLLFFPHHSSGAQYQSDGSCGTACAYWRVSSDFSKTIYCRRFTNHHLRFLCPHPPPSDDLLYFHADWDSHACRIIHSHYREAVERFIRRHSRFCACLRHRTRSAIHLSHVKSRVRKRDHARWAFGISERG